MSELQQMNEKEKKMSNLLEVTRYLQNAGVMFLASYDGELPHVRPVGFVMNHNERLYLSTGVGSNIYNDLHINENFELAALHPSLPMHRIRVSGKANFDVTESAMTKYFELNPAMKDVPGICVYELTDWKAIIYEGPQERKEIKG
jgi:uncharacterized pyridoxamine 5'-phosphate oxidase family protein